ncbi:MAG: tRNA (adenosine(37)-N6)-threonylcarbamoyltransferase complex dimerization subunit type 1 TsaB [Firmicutes bacterium]|nr:tRNA (adenosine(37)-N6)-threonylcarbamoyltransferase complex dimerization subunit type 1 TsaB [Bacillota bacterium]
MLILGIDTATRVCSVALLRGDNLLGELTVNIKKTHSGQLMPLVGRLLELCRVEREELEGIAVAAGPGSFTGIRIGVSTARALAQGLAIPAVGVSTLKALAGAVAGVGLLICPLLDARRGEVYAALYRRPAKPPYRLEELVSPGAMELGELLSRAAGYREPVTLLGEGLGTYRREIEGVLGERALPVPLGLNRAALVAWRGRSELEGGLASGYEELVPIYLRRPEAERKLREGR